MKLEISKRTIAIEILFFFSSIILMLIVWCAIILNNAYYQHSVNKLTAEISATATANQVPANHKLVEITDPELLTAEFVPSIDSIGLKRREMNAYQASIVTAGRINDLLFIFAGIIFLCLYVIRYFARLLLWSIKVIREDKITHAQNQQASQ